MTNDSDAKSKGPSTKRRTTLLLIVGAFTGLAPSAWLGARASESLTPLPNHRPDRPHADLKKFGPDRQVRMISHRDEIFRVTTRDGRAVEFRESDLRFKIDSTELGPRPGSPVILPAGSMDDLAWVFFATPKEIGVFIEERT